MATTTGSIDLTGLKASADIATNTEQYFWFNSQDSGAGEGAGAHITELPMEDFIDDPTNGGGNVLIDSDSVDVRDGKTVLASFGASGAVVGQNANGKSRTEIGTDGMQIYQGAGTANQIANLGYGPGTDSGGGSSDAPYYSLGSRKTTDGIGNYSVAEGTVCTASGYSSHAEGSGTKATNNGSHSEGRDTTASGTAGHAEGYETTASGQISHAEGWKTTASAGRAHAQNDHTIAAKQAQTALGTYNEEDTSATTTHPSGTAGYGAHAVIIGNGTSDNARSNALTVDWTGNLKAAASLFSGMTDEYAKKGTNHIVVAGMHICWGSETFATSTSYTEKEVALPYTYSSTSSFVPLASLANRSTQARTAYASIKDESTIYVGGVATTSRSVNVVWMTIGK